MEKEQIIKIGRFVYMKLFNDVGNVVLNKSEYYCDGKRNYDCRRLFWRFYIIINL